LGINPFTFQSGQLEKAKRPILADRALGKLYRAKGSVCYLGSMKLKPIIQVVQVDGVSRLTVGKTICGENFLACTIVVNITGDGIVEGLNGISIQDCTRLSLDPRLELGISRLFIGDVGSDGFGIES
jgi:hypothetical protein